MFQIVWNVGMGSLKEDKMAWVWVLEIVTSRICVSTSFELSNQMFWFSVWSLFHYLCVRMKRFLDGEICEKLMCRSWEQGDDLMLVSREQGAEQHLAATNSHDQTHSMHKFSYLKYDDWTQWYNGIIENYENLSMQWVCSWLSVATKGCTACKIYTCSLMLNCM